jgi:hypothetical protein
MHTQQAQTLKSASAARPVNLVLVRSNAPLFYSVASAALLESAVASRAEDMLRCFASDPTVRDWIGNVWLPAKLERARQLRSYVESVWPELDWTAASEQFQASTQVLAVRLRRQNGTHEALARCIAAAQSALYYRTLGRWADDQRLRTLADTIAKEEGAFLVHFRSALEVQCSIHRIGSLGGWRTARSCIREARDIHARTAFETLSGLWIGPAPFPALDYAEFVMRMRAVIMHRADLRLAERVLFRPWTKVAPIVEVKQVQASPNRGFKPVLAAAP